ncbi:MAG: hypothetical protein AAGG75_08455 [Bacteroidota bacterium]
MNADDFAEYLNQPTQLYRISWQELKSLAQQYPYCQNLHYLLAYKSQQENRKNKERHLQAAAVYSIDRAFLYQQFQRASQEEPVRQEHLEEEYLELTGLSSPPKAEIPPIEQLESSIEFIEPEREEEPLSIDLSSPKSSIPESASDNYIPLNELAEMDENKHKRPRDGNTDQPGAKKNVLFIEDLINPPKKEPKVEELVREPEQETPVEETPQLIKPLQEVEEVPQEEIEEIPVPPVEAVGLPSDEEGAEEGRKPEEIPLEITEESRPIAPVPKASFSSWLQRFRSPALSIRYNERKEEAPEEEKKVEPAKPPKPPKKKGKMPDPPKKPSTKAFAAKSFNDHDDLASETLAKIHERQGNYEAAIAMYQKLSLIFPEKSTFFAGKIENLKKLLP